MEEIFQARVVRQSKVQKPANSYIHGNAIIRIKSPGKGHTQVSDGPRYRDGIKEWSMNRRWLSRQMRADTIGKGNWETARLWQISKCWNEWFENTKTKHKVDIEADRGLTDNVQVQYWRGSVNTHKGNKTLTVAKHPMRDGKQWWLRRNNKTLTKENNQIYVWTTVAKTCKGIQLHEGRVVKTEHTQPQIQKAMSLIVWFHGSGEGFGKRN